MQRFGNVCIHNFPTIFKQMVTPKYIFCNLYIREYQIHIEVVLLVGFSGEKVSFFEGTKLERKNMQEFCNLLFAYLTLAEKESNAILRQSTIACLPVIATVKDEVVGTKRLKLHC